jgi:GNAT superfamily N-acetyltransferase
MGSTAASSKLAPLPAPLHEHAHVLVDGTEVLFRVEHDGLEVNVLAFALPHRRARERTLVGLGRFVWKPDSSEIAELEVQVSDTFQVRGLGTPLFSLLVSIARDRGASAPAFGLTPDHGEGD